MVSEPLQLVGLGLSEHKRKGADTIFNVAGHASYYPIDLCMEPYATTKCESKKAFVPLLYLSNTYIPK